MNEVSILWNGHTVVVRYTFAPPNGEMRGVWADCDTCSLPATIARMAEFMVIHGLETLVAGRGGSLIDTLTRKPRTHVEARTQAGRARS
jgi:hypothetical protein